MRPDISLGSIVDGRVFSALIQINHHADDALTVLNYSKISESSPSTGLGKRCCPFENCWNYFLPIIFYVDALDKAIIV